MNDIIADPRENNHVCLPYITDTLTLLSLQVPHFEELNFLPVHVNYLIWPAELHPMYKPANVFSLEGHVLGRQKNPGVTGQNFYFI